MSVSKPAEPSVPTAVKAARRRRTLFSAALISFSLTFLGVILAVLAGYLPAQQALLSGTIDPEVVLLFVPLAALVFAIVAEAARLSLKGDPLRLDASRPVPPLSAWTPGRGEG
jgi:hypothetical protein